MRSLTRSLNFRRLAVWWLVVALAVSPPAGAGEARVLLVVGDSLSAAFGMDTAQGWVSLLQRRLERERLPYRAVNASVSGDTSANGLARLPRLLAEHRPAVVIIELGGNDGLRGLAPERLRHNLAAMIQQCKAAGARVLLAGMRLPPNYGRPYTERFHAVYGQLVAEQGIAWVPFLLDGIATDPSLMQPDRIHPGPRAQPRLLDNVWPRLRPLL